MVGLIEFNLNAGQVFKILKKYNAKYYVNSNGAIPSGHQDSHDFASGVSFKIKRY